MTTTTTISELPGLVGTELGSSEWFEVTQEAVNTFAEATGDLQWIHVDVERAKKESPFGGPIAHGYLADARLFLGGLQLTLSVAVEREVGDKRFCIAEPIYRYYGG